MSNFIDLKVSDSTIKTNVENIVTIRVTELNKKFRVLVELVTEKTYALDNKFDTEAEAFLYINELIAKAETTPETDPNEGI